MSPVRVIRPKASPWPSRLGKGPAIKVKDAGMIVDPQVVDWMVKTAEQAAIPYQLEVLEHGGTDARSIQFTRAGCPGRLPVHPLPLHPQPI